MISQNTFRFHKFKEEEKKPDRYGNSYSKDFFNSNLLSTRQKSRIFPNRQSSSQDFASKNFNSKSYQFKNFNNIPSLTSRSFKKNNFFYSDDNINVSSNFPLGEIINTDFGFILKKGNTTIIDKFLPQMIYNDLSFSKNNHLQLILKKFQNVLEFLFTEQKKLLNNNNQIEELFNNQNSNLNKKLRQLEKDEYRTDNLLNANHSHISRLAKKINTYKNILKSTGNEKLIPNITLMKIEGKGGYYSCNICPDKIFKTYEEIHIHYIIEHFKSFNNRNIVYNSNELNKRYFENQLNNFKTQLKNELLNINKEFNDMGSNKKYLDIKSDMNLSDVINRSNKTLNSQTLRNKMRSSNNLIDLDNDDINYQLNRLESEQKEQFKRITDDFIKLKSDIFNELKKIDYNTKNENNFISNENIKSDINQKKYTNNDDIKGEEEENIKKYINNSKIIFENNDESKYSYSTPGLKNSSIQGPDINPYTIDNNNNINGQNNANDNKKSQFGKNINNINNKNSQLGENINDNNNNYFKQSIIYYPIEKEMKNSFIEKINQLDSKIMLSKDYNYIFDTNKNKERSKEIEEIIKEREQKYSKNKKDYKEIIYNIMKDNKNKGEQETKFKIFYNKEIKSYNIPELKNIEIEYLQKEEDIKKKEEEKKEKEKESEPAIDIEGFLDQEIIKSTKKKSIVKNDNYDSIQKLLETKDKNLDADL